MKISYTILALLMHTLTVNAQVNKDDKGIAVKGFDLVCYFQNTPKKGIANFSVKFKSATYLFQTEANKNLFISNPSKYLPMYGGYCAYAMGFDGSLVEIDPETYKIIDGKLYLFYNAYFNNTKTKWDKEEKSLKQKADNNWKLVASH
jgi:YHS domain-containing protein